MVGGLLHLIVSTCFETVRRRPLCTYVELDVSSLSTNVSAFASSAEVTVHAARALRPITNSGMAGTITPRSSRTGLCTSASQKKPGTAQPVCGPP